MKLRSASIAIVVLASSVIAQGNSLHFKPPKSIPAANRIRKSDVWYTYPQNSELPGYTDFGATGSFWGHMPQQDLYEQDVLDNWSENTVQFWRNQGLEYCARGEFDWGFRWFTEYSGDPTPHYVRDLYGNVITMWFMGNLVYRGYPNGWLSNHSPLFVPYMKSQVDALVQANISHIMFDSQTSSTRSTHLGQFGGDFHPNAISGFREFLRDKYTSGELTNLGIDDIDSFDFRVFLIQEGWSKGQYMRDAHTIYGGVPLMDDFVYFNREVFNEKFAEVLDYLRQLRPDINVGATTNIFEGRGYLFNDDLTFLAGELDMEAAAQITTMPRSIVQQLKAAEALGKTLVYFPFPFDFLNLYERNAPRNARAWIAQSYAMGAIFTIPANVWLGPELGVWNPGADNYRDLYQFVRAKEHLFDNYKNYAKVALAHSMLATMDNVLFKGSAAFRLSIRILLQWNINFDLLVFGDPGHPAVPTSADFDRYETIMYDSDREYLTDSQESLLGQYGSKLFNLGGGGGSGLQTIRFQNVQVREAGSPDGLLNGVSRVHETDASAPYVIHLLNRPLTTQGITTVRDVEVTIPADFFPEPVTSVIVHLPDGTSGNLPVTIDSDGVRKVNVTNLEVWGILECAH